jgi:hypothetical protein
MEQRANDLIEDRDKKREDFGVEGAEKIKLLEKEEKTKQTKKMQDYNNTQMEKEREVQAEKVKARMNRVVVHEGRMEMKRAPKPERKKQEKKVVISDEKLAELRYLGDLDEMMMH